MMKTITFLITSILAFSLSLPVLADQIKIATWNIQHLRDSNNEGHNKRAQGDYDRLAKYASLLNADIVALQEVEGAEAAKRVFNPTKYNFFFSRRNHVQLTGFAVKTNLKVIQNPDNSDLNVTGGLRNGTDITVTLDNKEIRFLSVHLKSWCWGNPMDSTKSDCVKLNKQLKELEKWIDARASEETPFIVLGDFNRRMGIRNDTFWPEIDDGEPTNADLSRVTEGRLSDCWAGEFPIYIDHIIFDLRSSKWVVDGSFSQLVYTEDESLKEKLSDHCPISIIINPALTGVDPKMLKMLNKIDQIERQLEDLRQMVMETQPD
jgi:endonuclease/exonuclease/phosphatase family metal-dependent hydrolase